MHKTVQFEMKAFLPNYYTMEQLLSGSARPCLAAGDGQLYRDDGYPFVGTAHVTLTVLDEDAIKANELEALNQQLQTVRAENQQRENAILDRISKLQAITYEAPEVV